MLTDNPYDSSRNNLPLMRYQITQTHEVPEGVCIAY